MESDGGTIRLSPNSSGLSGTTLDARYTLLQKLGEGGMGVVYEGRHTTLRNRVAIKVLRPSSGEDSDLTTKRRFLREARSAASIKHPNVVQIMDCGETHDGLVYIAMEYIEGRDIARVLKEEGPLSAPRATEIILQVAAALRASHAHGVIHRDIKPSNCILYDDEQGKRVDVVKVLDFGIAKANSPGLEDTQTLTAANELFGTVAYMAPELVEGTPASPQSDIYALGIMLFQVLTGRLPFTGPTPLKVLAMHASEPPPSIREHDPSLPSTLETIVARCLEKDPGRRYANMDELITALEIALDAHRPGSLRWRRTEPLTRTVALRNTVPTRTAVAPVADGDTAREVPSERPPAPSGRGTRVLRYTLVTVAIAIAVFLTSSLFPDDAMVEPVSARLTKNVEPDRGLAEADQASSDEQIVMIPAEAPAPGGSDAPKSATPMLSVVEPLPLESPPSPLEAAPRGEGDELPRRRAKKRPRDSLGSTVRRLEKAAKRQCSDHVETHAPINVSGPVGTNKRFIAIEIDGATPALERCLERVIGQATFPEENKIVDFDISL